MDTTRLSSKGQVVIPRLVRDAHGWPPGTELVIEDAGDAIVLRPRKPFPPTRLEDGLGGTGYRGPAQTVEEMDEGIAREVRRRWRERAS